jgi:hypothetical protein
MSTLTDTPQIEMLTPDAAANWTGLDQLPFEPIAERVLDLHLEGEIARHANVPEGSTAPLTVTFGKPTYIDGKGWCCVYKITSMGRDHITPAGGADSVHALQMAMHMVHNELAGMSRAHRITFLGTDDFGFGRVAGQSTSEAAAKCPVVGMSISS